MKPINSILITFPDIQIGHNKIEKFRREIIEMTGREADIFHNHTPEGGIIARYPKIQYRVIQDLETGRETAAIWAVEDGVKAAKSFLMDLEEVAIQTRPAKTELALQAEKRTYRLNHFIPFNDNNWFAYQQARSIRQRLAIIERALIGNLLNFCGDLGYRIPDRGLALEILDFKELGLKHCPTDKKDDLYLMAFDVIYETNLNMPQYAGLGRFKTKGYGWQTETDMCKIPTPKRRRLQNQFRKAVAED
jgi:hypothetical protein